MPLKTSICPQKVLYFTCISEPAEAELHYIFYPIFFESQTFHLKAILEAFIEEFFLQVWKNIGYSKYFCLSWWYFILPKDFYSALNIMDSA